jgi:2-oxoglutarate dehydrogenase complex dehydrogenase (E1) component-like enzyme
MMPAELDPATYGLTIWDLEREFLTGGVGGVEKQALGELLGVLRDAYCRTIGIEYMHIQDTDEQRWIQSQVEGVHHIVVRGSGDDEPVRHRQPGPDQLTQVGGLAAGR